MSNEESIPSRSQAKKPEAKADEAPKEAAKVGEAPKMTTGNLAGRYRVRDGYRVAHGTLNEQGHHQLAEGGSIVELTHEEALSLIRTTKDQKNADGTPNGPAIETEAAYNTRIQAKLEHEKFLKQLEEANANVSFGV